MQERNLVFSPDHVHPVPEQRRDIEKQILDALVFKDIDLSRPENRYHTDMVRGLTQLQDSGRSLIHEVLEQEQLLGRSLERVVVESVVAEDISKGIGQKRNVDRFLFQFADGAHVMLSVSLDIEQVERAKDSPSMCEAQVLKDAREIASDYSPVQKYYGSTLVKDETGMRGLICKEYLPGEMLSVRLAELQSDASTEVQAKRRAIAHEVGRTFVKSIAAAGGVPVDAHGNNFILHKDEHDRITARFCDVEYVRADASGIRTERMRLERLFGQAQAAFRDGMTAAQTEFRITAPIFF